MNRRFISTVVMLLASFSLRAEAASREEILVQLTKRSDVVAAAKQAVLCLGWPKGLQEKASRISVVKGIEGQSMAPINLPSNSVIVGRTGCSEVEIVVFTLSEAENYIRVPYSANVYAPDLGTDTYLYILFLAEAHVKNGIFIFYGMRTPIAPGHGRPMAPVDRYDVSFVR